jgi:hypothetical protein
MRPVTTLLVSLAAVPLFLLGTGSAGIAQDGKRPLLSEEISRVLGKDGPEAAERHFNEIYPARADRYEIDLNGMAMLAAAQIQANEIAAAEAVFRMVSVLQEGELAKYMPGVAAAAQEEQERDAVQRDGARRAEAQETEPTDLDLGPSRDDLSRFFGEYGDPDGQDRQPVPRNLYIFQTCDGYLVAAPMWADVSPWILTSTGDTSFEHSSFHTFTMNFEVDEEGNAAALVQEGDDLGTEGSHLQRIKPLEDPTCWVWRG